MFDQLLTECSRGVVFTAGQNPFYLSSVSLLYEPHTHNHTLLYQGTRRRQRRWQASGRPVDLWLKISRVPLDMKKQLARMKVEATLAHWHKTDEEESMAKVAWQHSSEFMEGAVASFACAWQAAAEESFAKITWRNSSAPVATGGAVAAAAAPCSLQRRASSSPQRSARQAAAALAKVTWRHSSAPATEGAAASSDSEKQHMSGLSVAKEAHQDKKEEEAHQDSFRSLDLSRLPEIERDTWVPRQLARCPTRPRQKLPMWGRGPTPSLVDKSARTPSLRDPAPQG